MQSSLCTFVLCSGKGPEIHVIVPTGLNAGNYQIQKESIELIASYLKVLTLAVWSTVLRRERNEVLRWLERQGQRERERVFSILIHGEIKTNIAVTLHVSESVFYSRWPYLSSHLSPGSSLLTQHPWFNLNWRIIVPKESGHSLWPRVNSAG